jgi:hypothetical protein
LISNQDVAVLQKQEAEAEEVKIKKQLSFIVIMKDLKVIVINQPAFKTQNKCQDHSKVTNEEEWSSHLLMEYS